MAAKPRNGRILEGFSLVNTAQALFPAVTGERTPATLRYSKRQRYLPPIAQRGVKNCHRAWDTTAFGSGGGAGGNHSTAVTILRWRHGEPGPESDTFREPDG